MNKFKTKLCLSYFTVMGFYGFYRGFYNKYNNNSVLNIKLNKQLYVDRIATGLFSTAYYLTPMFHPYIFYYSIKRTEKNIRGLDITEDDWDY